MNTQLLNNPSWKDQLKKQASTQEAPRDDIAEAFAAQAYTAVENRAGLLMTDPHLLGFEVIERNEANNRIVGAFAFRVGEELVLAPVFFLNGTVKGQYLLYRKTKDQFVPNNKTQIRAILATAGSGPAGQGVDRGSSRGAVMEFDARSLAAPRKFAAEHREEILETWKQACACAVNHEKVATRHIFKEFLLNNPGFEKKAADLATTDHEFAEGLVISGALGAPVIMKQATAVEAPTLTLVTSMPESPEKLAAIQEDLFKRGYAIEDTRPEDDLLEAFQVGASEEYLRTSPHHGIDYALDPQGKPVKVLVAPIAGRKARTLLVLEGPDKGKKVEVNNDSPGDCGGFRGQYVFTDNTPSLEPKDDFEGVGKAKPSKDKEYIVFSKSQGKFSNLGCVKVEKVSTDGPVCEIDTKWDGKIIQRSDIEETSTEELNPGHRACPTLGADCVWIECDNDYNGPNLLRADRLFDFVINKVSRGHIQLGKKAGVHYLQSGRKRIDFPSASGAAMKLASLGLSAHAAMSLVDEAEEGKTLEFEIVPKFDKIATAWYEREPDAENDFIPYGRDPDLGVAIDDVSGIPQQYNVRRSMPTQEAGRFLDAPQPIGGGFQDHIPDEALLNMSNPAQELSQAAEDSGFDHLIDHGALGSLVKTFDAVSLAISYLPDLEKGVDRLGRIIFLLLWKPADFAEKFGENDMPHLENTLVSAFEKHGDLVLELRQNTGNE